MNVHIFYLGTHAHPSGDYGDAYYLVDQIVEDNRRLVTHKQVLEYLADNDVYAYNCGHSHDCCGCVSRHYPRVVTLDRVTEHWIVRQAWARNV